MAINQPPTATDDPGSGSASLFTTSEDKTFVTGSVLSNDSDSDNDSLSVSNVNTNGTVGLVSSNGDGTFTYNPNGKFNSLDDGETATDSFAYTVSDGKGGTATATVTVTIDGVSDAVVNQPPNARDDSYSVLSGQTLNVPFSAGLLDNDTDDGALTVVEVNGQSVGNSDTISLANGSLTINSNGSFSYTPDVGFAAVESFAYTVSDGAKTDTASVDITVNSPPPSGDGLPITDKLVARFESDLNVVEKNGVVTGWRSGAGPIDLVAVGDPRLVKGATPTGQAAISLDGGRTDLGETGAVEGDGLRKVTPGQGLSDLPSGSDPRTMYFVVDYTASNGVFAGVTYGKGRDNNSFGLTLNGKKHMLTVHGVGGSNSFADDKEKGLGNNDGSAGDDWFIQSVRYDGNTLRHYRDNQLIDTDSHEYNTIVEQFLIGENAMSRGFSSLDVAAVLVYDKELSDSEHAQTIDYLTRKYIAESTQNGQSTSQSNSAPISVEPDAETVKVDRITEDLIALYTFDESTGTSVKDTSGTGKAFNLGGDDLTGAQWEDGALSLDAPTLLSSGSPAKLADALTGDAVTLEAWITPDSSDQAESGPVVSLATKNGKRAFNTELSLFAPNGLSTNERSHLVYTVDSSGSAALYVDGELVGTDTATADFSALAQKYELTLGGGPGSSSSWLGTLDLVAVYSQFFDASEVAQNFLAGPS
jgi:VCBS repeat-containing protein